eukprot:gb/GEZN01004349.1/.p1 GENE.gb/GEZN01004349.1/~~gb/GEZN01004349.1/.p1  ORF type:complete len:578 (+),score=36.52 gb/GEZN01004349.1/:91-1824(+)
MFRDLSESSALSGQWTTVNLAMGVMVGLASVSSLQIWDVGCSELKSSVLISSFLVLPTLLSFNVLSDRQHSLHITRYMVLMVVASLVAFSCILTSLVFLGRLMSLYSQSRVCRESHISQTVGWLVMVLGTLWNLCALVLLGTVIYLRIVFMKPACRDLGAEWAHIHWLRTKRGHLIPTRFFHHPKAHFTFLYSHGNAEDLGTMFRQGKCQGLRDQLEVNVFAWEYPGYGFATGYPTEVEINDAIETAYHSLIEHWGVAPSQIILYGRSMGSGPTTYLAAKLSHPVSHIDHQRLGGVILESALLSIYSTCGKCFSRWRHWGDMFINQSRIDKIAFPILFLHGQADQVVPFWHAERLHGLARQPSEPPHWVASAGHNNMPDVWQYRPPERKEGEKDQHYTARVSNISQCNLLNKAVKLRFRNFLTELRAPAVQSPSHWLDANAAHEARSTPHPRDAAPNPLSSFTVRITSMTSPPEHKSFSDRNRASSEKRLHHRTSVERISDTSILEEVASEPSRKVALLGAEMRGSPSVEMIRMDDNKDPAVSPSVVSSEFSEDAANHHHQLRHREEHHAGATIVPV